MRPFAIEAVDAAFELLGDNITYTPTVGAPAVITAIRTQAEKIHGLPFGSSALSGGAIFEVRIADLASEPAAGDVITSIESENFTVRSISTPDIHALKRRLDCVPA